MTVTNELAVRIPDGGELSFTRDKIDLLKRTICRGATDDELELFVHAAQKLRLDPFMRQVHAVKRWDAKEQREVMTIQTGIDGYRLVADRTGRYMPGREPSFTYDTEGFVLTATAYAKKMDANGQWHELAATAHWDEYVGTTKEGKPTKMWDSKPHIMLAKCAEALVLRRAFPAELSGVYTAEEMDQAGGSPVVSDLPERPAPTTDHARKGNGAAHAPTAPTPTPTAAKPAVDPSDILGEIGEREAEALKVFDEEVAKQGHAIEAGRRVLAGMLKAKGVVGGLHALNDQQIASIIAAASNGDLNKHFAR